MSDEVVKVQPDDIEIGEKAGKEDGPPVTAIGTPIEDVKRPKYNFQQNGVVPIKVTWTDLCYEVNVSLDKVEAQRKGIKTERKKIVKNATGYAIPGEALFIMGSSGAGKTSLLNILSDRISLSHGAE